MGLHMLQWGASYKKNTKIMITGAAGAIGLQLAKYLVNKGLKIYVVDNFVRGSLDHDYLEFIKSNLVTPLNGDLTDCDFVKTLPLDVDYIFHLAAINGTQNFYNYSFQVLLNSTVPTINLLRHYISKSELKRFIYTSSSEAYSGAISLFDWEIPTKETVPLVIDDPQNARWSYGASKMHGEIACVAAFNEGKVNYSIIRLHNVYGPRMGYEHIIPDFIYRLRKGEVCLYGAYDTRAFIYVDDAIRDIEQIALSDRCINDIVNVGSNSEIQILTLAKEILSLTHIQEEIEIHPSPVGSVKRRVPNLEKLNSIYPTRNLTKLKCGLIKTLKWYAPDLLV